MIADLSSVRDKLLKSMKYEAQVYAETEKLHSALR
jgi:hypothetical protein